MKKTLTIILLVSLTAIICYAQTKNTESNKTEEYIKQLDKQWLVDPYWSGDMKDYDRITADDFKSPTVMGIF